MSQAQYEQQGAAEQWHEENDMIDLLKLNVNEHTEKKNGLTYLSWAWAWRKVLELDPLAEWMPLYFGPETNQTPYLPMPDGSMMVGVTVHMKGKARQCMLPVMDHRNKAIKNPDAFAVNTAMMRCLAKAIAMHGLGLYIYAGEDLPEEAEPEPEQKKGAPKHTPTGTPLVAEARMSLIADVADAVRQHIDADDVVGAYEEASGITDAEERTALWKMLDSRTRSALKAHSDQLKKEAGFARA